MTAAASCYSYLYSSVQEGIESMGNSSSDEGSVLASDGTTPRLYECAEKIRADQWPIIYSPVYNIGFMGFEKMHPFDSGKWGKVYQFLLGK